jgi:hypothetical protein
LHAKHLLEDLNEYKPKIESILKVNIENSLSQDEWESNLEDLNFKLIPTANA